MSQAHCWREIIRIRPRELPETISHAVYYCPACGAVRAQLERQGQVSHAPDYWRVGSDGQAEFEEPACQPVRTDQTTGREA